MGVGEAIRKTIHARQAAADLGFEKTSESLGALRERLESFKNLGEDNRQFGAQMLWRAVEETREQYVSEADRGREVPQAFRRRAVAKIVAAGAAIALAGAGSSWAIAAEDAALGLGTAAGFAAALACVPFLGIKWFRNSIVSRVRCINEAINESKEAASVYLGH